MFSLIAWIILAILGGILTLWAVWSRYPTKWRTLSLLLFLGNIFLGGGAIFLSQGWASSCSFLLPGKYEMIGYLPVPDDVIYLFLDTQYGPKTCYVPFSDEKVGELEKNEKENGSDFNVTWGDDGEGGFGVPGWSNDGTFTPRPKPDHPDKPEDVNGAST